MWIHADFDTFYSHQVRLPKYETSQQPETDGKPKLDLWWGFYSNTNRKNNVRNETLDTSNSQNTSIIHEKWSPKNFMATQRSTKLMSPFRPDLLQTGIDCVKIPRRKIRVKKRFSDKQAHSRAKVLDFV